MPHAVTELLDVQAPARDLLWLRKSLQTAIEMEFATIPPYLTAYWSIIPGDDPDGVADILRSVVLEEMLHMALLSNLLVAVGGAPRFNRRGIVPAYPCAWLPGSGSGPNIGLRKLSLAAVDMFMAVENPAHNPAGYVAATHDGRHCIGEFHDAINAVFAILDPALSDTHQLECSAIGLFAVHSLIDVSRAIRALKKQGEGFANSAESTPGITELPHYYRLAEIFHGRRLKRDTGASTWSFAGDPVRFPEVLPMADVPAGGYGSHNVCEADWSLVEQDVIQFNQTFTIMLHHLETAWGRGSPTELNVAMACMFALAGYAVSLMSVPIAGGSGNYGPSFRLVPSQPL